MATIAESLKKSSYKISNISKTLESTKKGIASTTNSVENISKIITNNTKIKSELFERTLILDARRREASNRKELEDQIESSKVSTSRSNGFAFTAKSETSPLGRLLAFLGYTTAGWIMENLPTWIFIGKEFLARAEKFGKLMGSLINNIRSIFSSFGQLLSQSLSSVLRLDFEEFSEGNIGKLFDDLKNSVKSVGDDITSGFGLFKQPLTESAETGQKAPGLGDTSGSSLYETSPPSQSPVTGIHKQALDIISGPESGGDYNAMNNGKAGDRPGGSKKWLGKNLTDMTIGEIMDYQNNKKSLWAAGRYQFIPNTLPGVMKSAGLKPSDPFSAQNQDLMALALMRERGLQPWTVGGSKYSAEQVAIVEQARRTPVSLAKPQPAVVGASSDVKSTVGTEETGKGFNPSGAKDAQGRPVVLSREAAGAFAAMIRDSKGQVKGSDVASSQRSPEKNERVGGVTGSKHLSGLALDIHGSSNSWIRKFGSKYGWYANDYSGTHGGHFEFRGGAIQEPPAEEPSVPSAEIAPQVASSDQLTQITPERTGPNVSVIDNREQQTSQPAPQSGKSTSPHSPLSDQDLLNNFIKNKLLIDLAYL